MPGHYSRRQYLESKEGAGTEKAEELEEGGHVRGIPKESRSRAGTEYSIKVPVIGESEELLRERGDLRPEILSDGRPRGAGELLREKVYSVPTFPEGFRSVGVGGKMAEKMGLPIAGPGGDDQS